MHYNKLSETLRAKNTEKVVKYCGEKNPCFQYTKKKKKNLHIHLRTLAHASPHLHNSIEFIYITEGTLELGMGQELSHMEEGDVSGSDGQRSGHQQVHIVQSFFRNLSPEFQSVSQ